MPTKQNLMRESNNLEFQTEKLSNLSILVRSGVVPGKTGKKKEIGNGGANPETAIPMNEVISGGLNLLGNGITNDNCPGFQPVKRLFYS